MPDNHRDRRQSDNDFVQEVWNTEKRLGQTGQGGELIQSVKTLETGVLARTILETK